MHEEIQQKNDLLVRLLEKFNETIKDNTKDLMRFAEELTYKGSNFYITINFGIIAAGSFVFGGKVLLSPASRTLSIFLLCSIISIMLEVLFRKDALNANIKYADKRAESIEKIQIELIGHLKENLAKPIDEYCKYLGVYDKKYKEELDCLYKELNEISKKVSWKRAWSFRLMMTSISALTLVLIIESGAFKQIALFGGTLWEIIPKIL